MCWILRSLFGLVLIITPHCNCNLHSFHSMNLNWIFQLIEQHCLRRSRIIAASERCCYKDVLNWDCYHKRTAIKIFQSVLVLHLRATLCLSRIGSETAFDKVRRFFFAMEAVGFWILLERCGNETKVWSSNNRTVLFLRNNFVFLRNKIKRNMLKIKLWHVPFSIILNFFEE